MAMKPRFDGQPALEAYGDGGFRLAGQRFEGSLIVTPLGVYPWDMRSLSDVTMDSLAPVMEAVGTFDFLIVGSGETAASLPEDVYRRLTSEVRLSRRDDNGAGLPDLQSDDVGKSPRCRGVDRRHLTLAGCQAWLFPKKLLAFSAAWRH